MTDRRTAVDAVMGRLFEHGLRKRPGGSSGGPRGAAARKPSIRRMSRIGAQDGAAVFKLIKSGGTDSRSGLKGQLNYIFRDDKLAHVIDPTGRIAPDARPETADVDRITRDWSVDWWAGTRNGQTSHMILSYPQSVTVDEVTKITRDVCAQMFEGEGRRFKYVVAVHEDTEHHPHAHVIVNRRADDKTLFTMRSGTAHSYEGFREAMADHGIKYGVQLDPSFRFERGITDRQPTRTEQRDAQAQGRGPEDRARTGASLAYHDNLVSHAHALSGAMAVIAHNADADRLEAAYGRLSDILETRTGETPMPTLSEEELERFDQTAALIGTALERAERTLQDRDPAARAGAERELSEVMKDLTRLSPTAPYAEELHRDPSSASVYQHGPGEAPEALRSESVQARLSEIERDYGIPADAVTARLEGGASSNHLEQTWIKADIEAIMERDGLHYGDAQERVQIVDRLDAAHADLREVLVDARAIEHLPHLDPEYTWEPLQSETYRFTTDRETTDLTDILDHYRQSGAPESWIAENRALLLDELRDRRAVELDGYVSQNDDLTVHRDAQQRDTDLGRGAFTEAERAEIGQELQDRNLVRDDPAEMRQAVGEDYAARYPTMPHHVVDRLTIAAAGAYETERGRLADTDRPGQPPVLDLQIQVIQARATASGDAAQTPAEHQQVIKHLRETLTADEYQRFERGDIRAVDRITGGDATLSRQLLREVEADSRQRGVIPDRATEARLTEEREALARTLGEDRDPDRDRDDDDRGR